MPIKNWTPERLAQKRENQNRWRSKPANREYWNAYTRSYLQKHRVNSRPPIPTSCPHCLQNSFKWHSNSWICIPCRAAQSAANEKSSRLRRYRRRQIRKRAASLSLRHGEHVASAYLSYASLPTSKLAIGPSFIKSLCLPSSHQSLSQSTLERIHLLNDISNLPWGSIGWSCRLCSLPSSDPAFFDIDHILPRHKSGSSAKSNLQPLCPNCHRIKCLSEYSLRISLR